MRNCKGCARLRKKLSPMEDADFTKEYQIKEPVKFYRASVTKVKGEACILFKASDCFEARFGRPGNLYELTVLGRTLKGLGFERTNHAGWPLFKMPLAEAVDVYEL